MTTPATCPDFVSHPHVGCYTCQVASASEEQGTTAIATELTNHSIACDVHQTGGFTMCVYIPLNNGAYIYANNEGFSFYKDEDCDGWANYSFANSENTPAKKAEAIIQTMKVVHA